jgi:tetratricopeptide (TPR) repeat protein
MWIKCFFFCLIFNQVFGSNNHLIVQDSTSNQKFKSEFKSIQLIKNEKKRNKLLDEFVSNHAISGDLFTNYAYNLFNKDNLASLWLDQCGKNVDNLLKTGDLSLVQQFAYGLYEQQIPFSEIERLFIQKIQQFPDDPNLIELLVSTYIFNGDWERAWNQRRALDMRFKNEQGKRLLEFASYIFQSQQWSLASKIFDYLIKSYPGSNQKSRWQQMSIAARKQVVLRKENPEIAEVKSLISAYQKLRSDRGDNAISMSSYWQEAKLYAYQLKQLDSAVLVLNKGILLAQNDLDLQAQMKLELGDILTYKGKKYDALIQYAQVEKQVKDSPLAYEAKIKSAKLYFYTGDFELAKELADILKQGTQREIANDALELSLLIEDNTGIDSLEVGLKNFANIRFMYDQKRWEEGDSLLALLTNQNKQESLQDDILYLRATRARQKGENAIAKEMYWEIFKKFPEDIYGDDALFYYLTLVDTADSDPFLLFIKQYPSSLHLSDVRVMLNNAKK